MGVTNQIVGLLLSLSILVIVHEFGHYCFARLFKTRVEKFYMFFNPWFSLVRMKKIGGRWHFKFFASNVEAALVPLKDANGNTIKDENGKDQFRAMTDEERKTLPQDDWRRDPDNTEWGIGWLPFGGYCSIAGMVDETKEAGALQSEPQTWEFRTKPAWQRLLIILGGVLVNFVTALVLYTVVLYSWGEEFIPVKNATYGFHFSNVALDAGFQNGDKIVSLDGQDVRDVGTLITTMVIDGTKSVQVERGNDIVEIILPEDFGKSVVAQSESRVPVCQFDMPFVIDSVLPGLTAYEAGLKKGDSLVAINDSTIFSFFDFQSQFVEYKGDSIKLSYIREDSLYDVEILLSDKGQIGVAPKPPYAFLKSEKVEYSLLESVPKGIAKGLNTLSSYVKQFKFVFSKEGATQLGGFGTLGSIFPKTWNWEMFWSMTAFLSMALAFMNFLPIPALDGGYILFILVEMITRKKPSDKFLSYANTVGFALLLALLIWANGLDVLRALR
ncbi:MAG: RIP metalloprotease RseP [Bacteroidales bacterium]|nr:RIP metalloprotease RseP [Bacteroidales bacterium]